ESAKGVIRSEVGRQTGVRHTPTLTFVLDEVQENAQHIEQLLAQARQEDEEKAERAAGAKPVGDPDPYRPPREDVDDNEGHFCGGCPCRHSFLPYVVTSM